MKQHKHIVVGLSGGVDSSVTAALLREQGYDVTAIFMQNWQAEDDPYCQAEADLSDARSVCDKLGIPLKTVNFAKEYWDRVFNYFLDELAAGRTPNPDVMCNQEIKFKAFLEHALSLGADGIATGHYARTQITADDVILVKGLDNAKDQTYFLHRLDQHQLKHSIFPIGHLEKSQVRLLAQQLGLTTSTKKDSTGICFIGERKFSSFLKEYLLAQPGDIETDKGERMGLHQGLMYYTLGQRQGLGIGGNKKYAQAPWYVLEKDIARNTLIVGQDPYHPRLMKTTLECERSHWILDQPTLPFRCKAKIRYRQEDQACTITQQTDARYHVTFDQPQRAITPGQSVVFYENDLCLGGAIIC